jgi:hypothetical protein
MSELFEIWIRPSIGLYRCKEPRTLNRLTSSVRTWASTWLQYHPAPNLPYTPQPQTTKKATVPICLVLVVSDLSYYIIIEQKLTYISKFDRFCPQGRSIIKEVYTNSACLTHITRILQTIIVSTTSNYWDLYLAHPKLSWLSQHGKPIVGRVWKEMDTGDQITAFSRTISLCLSLSKTIMSEEIHLPSQCMHRSHMDRALPSFHLSLFRL